MSIRQLLLLSAFSCAAVCTGQNMTIPATADLQLAGWPPGTTASYDTAPMHSPVLVASVQLRENALLRFAVSGQTERDSAGPYVGPDGYYPSGWHSVPPINGISGIDGPLMGLCGVFLTDNIPDTNSPPASLEFLSPESKNFRVFKPRLRQQFFIGDGKDSSGNSQEFVVPAGATRLFLGIIDDGHYNNLGSLTVTMTQTPYMAISLYPGITISGAIGSTQRVDYVSEVGSTNWVNLTNFVMQTPSFLFIDTTTPMPIRRFYRCVEVN